MSRELSHLELLVLDGSVMQFDETVRAAKGECRYCGCTDDNACILDAPDNEDENFEPDRRIGCSWYREPNHHGLGVCSNPECVKSYLADRGAP